MTADYPRDMKGYGRAIPDPKWPDGARVAVQFVLNYEEGGENNVLHGDAASEAFLSEIVGAQPWPGQRHWNMESIYEYGLGDVYKRQDQVQAMKEAGWEIASHGLKWVEHKDMPEDEERRQIAEAIRVHTALTGERPLGWYTGRCSMNTTKLVMEEGGFLYSSDDYADDLPYFLRKPDGGRHLIIPYTLDANDMRFATPQGFNTGEHFYQYLKDSFDCLYEEGRRGSPKMMSVGLHCRLAGRPGRALGLARFLDYVMAHEQVWVPRRIDIARHWLQNFS